MSPKNSQKIKVIAILAFSLLTSIIASLVIHFLTYKTMLPNTILGWFGFVLLFLFIAGTIALDVIEEFGGRGSCFTDEVSP